MTIFAVESVKKKRSLLAVGITWHQSPALVMKLSHDSLQPPARTHASVSTCEMEMPPPALRAGSGRHESTGGAPGPGLASKRSHPFQEAQNITDHSSYRFLMLTPAPRPPGTEHKRSQFFLTPW